MTSQTDAARLISPFAIIDEVGNQHVLLDALLETLYDVSASIVEGGVSTDAMPRQQAIVRDLLEIARGQHDRLKAMFFEAEAALYRADVPRFLERH